MTEHEIPWDNILFNEQGLVPAIIQDVNTKKVLMLAYMNKESLQKTIEMNETWFWSRSRQQYWNKGESSGHRQYVKSIAYDCDGDTLLIGVEQIGSACHTGATSCFYRSIKTTNIEQTTFNEKIIDLSNGEVSPTLAVIKELETLIAKRDANRPEGAYTTYLFQQGLDKILKKIGEEASEVIIAAKNGNNKELSSEAADLIYHLLVLLQQNKLPLDQVLVELQKRKK